MNIGEIVREIEAVPETVTVPDIPPVDDPVREPATPGVPSDA